MRLKTTDLAWAAGIVDGEGCFILRLAKPPPASGGVNRYWSMRVIVSMTDRPVIEKLHTMIPGTRSVMNRDKIKASYKKAFQIEWISLRALHVLRLLTPYLVGKREQAEIMLDVLSKRYKAGNHKMTEKQKRTYETAAKKIHRLKQRRYK